MDRSVYSEVCNGLVSGVAYNGLFTIVSNIQYAINGLLVSETPKF